MFSRGGIQGGEGVTGGEAWYIENVMEELDSEREWFFDTPTSTLYDFFLNFGLGLTLSMSHSTLRNLC